MTERCKQIMRVGKYLQLGRLGDVSMLCVIFKRLIEVNRKIRVEIGRNMPSYQGLARYLLTLLLVPKLDLDVMFEFRRIVQLIFSE